MKLTAEIFWQQYTDSGKKHLLITGWRGKGKTTLFNKLIKFICPADTALPGLTSVYIPKEGVMLVDNTTKAEAAVGIYCPEKAEIGKSMIPYSDGNVGVSYVLRHGLPPACSAFAYAKNAIGKPAAEIAAWLMEKDDYIGRSIGSSVLSAASQQLSIPDDNNPDKMFGIDSNNEDTVGMIGLIEPVAKALQSRVKEVIVFDESVSASKWHIFWAAFNCKCLNDIGRRISPAHSAASV